MKSALLLRNYKLLKDQMFDFSDYQTFKKAEIIQSRVISTSPENELEEVIRSFGEMTEIYPGNKVKNVEKYCAKAASIVCFENNLSAFGASILIDMLQRKCKALPSLSEIYTETIAFKKEIDDCDPWFEKQSYNSAHKSFRDDLNNQGVAFNSTDLKSFEHLFIAWPKVFPFDGFLDTKKFNPTDSEYLERLTQKLLLPLPNNIMFFLLDVMLKFNCSMERAAVSQILDIDKKSLIQEIRKQFPDHDGFGFGAPFLTPAEWLKFNWKNVLYSPDSWDSPFEPFPPLLFRLIANDAFENDMLDNKIYSRLAKMTKQHFGWHEMFQ